MNSKFIRWFRTGYSVGLHQMGPSLTETAQRVGVTRRTVARWWSRFQETGSVLPKPMSGRRRRTTARSDRLLTRLAKHHCLATGGRSELLHIQVNLTGLAYSQFLEHFAEKYRADLPEHWIL